MLLQRPFLHAFILLALLSTLGLEPAAAQQQDSTAPAPQARVDTMQEKQAARTAARTWLAYNDAENYQKSWETAAPLLKNRLSQEKWAKAGKKVRSQVGALQERTLARSQYTTSLRGLPEGEYVILLYGSRFEKAARAQETLVVMRQDAGWKVAGYNVRPARQQNQQQ